MFDFHFIRVPLFNMFKSFLGDYEMTNPSQSKETQPRIILLLYYLFTFLLL